MQELQGQTPAERRTTFLVLHFGCRNRQLISVDLPNKNTFHQHAEHYHSRKVRQRILCMMTHASHARWDRVMWPLLWCSSPTSVERRGPFSGKRERRDWNSEKYCHSISRCSTGVCVFRYRVLCPRRAKISGSSVPTSSTRKATV